MTRALRLLCLCLAALVALPAATATAAKAVTYPTVKKISPMKATVGDTLTITGTGFVPGRDRNTVVFQRKGQPAVFAKAGTATSTRLTVVLPDKLTRFITDGPAKFPVRILGRRFGKTFTTEKLSPTIGARAAAVAPAPVKPVAAPAVPAAPAAAPAVPAAAPAPAPAPAAAAAPAPPAPPAPDCAAAGAADDADPSDDADLLPDAVEDAIKTDRCLADTDFDGLQDGWEYKSALDLNRESCRDEDYLEYPVPCSAARPYPRDLPYPNPLDDSDAGTDFDGDRLNAAQEHAAWLARKDRSLASLWYSDGLQASQDGDPTDGCRGLKTPTRALGGRFTLSPSSERFYSLDDIWGDGCLEDSERDEDGDYLSNYQETTGPLSSPTWTLDIFEEVLFPVAHAGTDWLDGDTDEDGVVDGFDDQDFDDFWNVEEKGRGFASSVKKPAEETTPPAGYAKVPWRDTGLRSGLWGSPFNPCLPSSRSRTCPQRRRVGEPSYPPFLKGEDKEDPAKWPVRRWPMYGAAEFDFNGQPELWDGLPAADQRMPPLHPLPR